MREYFENEICANCCIDKQFCDRCGVRKKTANSEKEKPALMDRLYESDRNCDGNCKNCVAICGTTQNTIFLEAADAIEELLAFAKFVARQAIDTGDNDGVSAEILCRKLNKLGLIETDGEFWMLPEPPKEDV